jgi:hypothetical protein
MSPLEGDIMNVNLHSTPYSGRYLRMAAGVVAVVLTVVFLSPVPAQADGPQKISKKAKAAASGTATSAKAAAAKPSTVKKNSSGTVKSGKSAASALPSDAFFNGNAIQDINIVMKAEDWDTLRARYMSDDYYPADFQWNG